MPMNRILKGGARLRIFLFLLGAWVMGCGGGGAGSPATPDPAAINSANAAFLYGYPLNETMRVCDLYPTVNQMVYITALKTAADRSVVSPNNDTLYGSACVYLGSSWAMVTMPAANGRYMSLQVLDAYTNNVAVLGPKQIPASGSGYVLHLAGTSTAGLSAGAPVIDVPTPYAYVITRTLVQGPSDLSAAVAVQSGITLVSNSVVVPNRVTPLGSTPAIDFFLKLMLRLAQNPPPASEAALVASLVAAGIVPSASPSTAGVSAGQIAAWESAYALGLAALDSGTGAQGRFQGAWWTGGPNLGSFGADYAFRAQTARSGLFALPPSEAMYLTVSTGLDGRTGRVITFPAGTWPPVVAPGFWSLTMYGPDHFLIDNPMNRYSVGGFTPGLHFESDGSMNIYVQTTDPGGARTSNWLPAPAGPYSVTMRLYLPTAEVIQGTYLVPPLQ